MALLLFSLTSRATVLSQNFAMHIALAKQSVPACKKRPKPRHISPRTDIIRPPPLDTVHFYVPCARVLVIVSRFWVQLARLLMGCLRVTWHWPADPPSPIQSYEFSRGKLQTSRFRMLTPSEAYTGIDFLLHSAAAPA